MARAPKSLKKWLIFLARGREVWYTNKDYGSLPCGGGGRGKSNGGAIFYIDSFPQHETNNKGGDPKNEKENRSNSAGSDHAARHAADVGICG